VPVGRLVLLVFGSSTPERVLLSDDVCIGLQLVEHLQDVAEDAARGRIYLPASELEAFGVNPDDLVATHASRPLQRLVAVHVARARRLLASGRPLTRALPWSQGAAVAGFAGGGLAALDAIQRAGYDVLGTRCRPRPHRLGAHMVDLRFGSVAA
jgi:phytoene/squalene synthetase